MKKKKVLFGALGCTVLMFNGLSPVIASTELIQQQLSYDKKISNKSGDINIPTAFPDVNFQNQIKKYDINGDGFLSQSDILKITNLTLSKISNLTGIKYLTSLSDLTIENSSITDMDLRGMTSLYSIEYATNNSKLKTLDLRNCDNLVSAHHSAKGEIVWISAGMTKFVGCQAIVDHTGNINIDLEGIAIINSDGSKQVDLSTIISRPLLSVFKKRSQPGFDPSTNMLTIPKDATESQYTAGEGEHGQLTTWTFYTDADEPDPTWPNGAPNGWKAFAGKDVTLLKDSNNSLFGDYVYYSDQQSAIYKEFKGKEAFKPRNYRVTVYAKGDDSSTPPTLPLKVSLKEKSSSGESRTLLLVNSLSSGQKVDKGFYKVSSDVTLSSKEKTPLITVENYQAGYIAGIFIEPIK